MPNEPNLDAPGRRYVIHDGPHFYIYGHRYGCLEIERAGDQSTAFFQGDDADILQTEIDAAEKHGRPIDDVRADYSDILTTPED